MMRYRLSIPKGKNILQILFFPVLFNFPFGLSKPSRSQQHQEKYSWKHHESNPGLLSEKQVCYLCAIQPLILIDTFDSIPIGLFQIEASLSH